LRGSDERTGSLFSYVDLEARVRKDHPLRTIRLIVNETLAAMERDLAVLYSGTGRPSIAPEKLLRTKLLQAFYSVRSERQLMERLEFDLLLRWFVGIGVDEPVWDHSVFSKNRDRLLEGAIAARFLSTLLTQPKVPRRETPQSAVGRVAGFKSEWWPDLFRNGGRHQIGTMAGFASKYLAGFNRNPQRWTRARNAIPAMPRASGSASGSKRPSAG